MSVRRLCSLAPLIFFGVASLADAQPAEVLPHRIGDTESYTASSPRVYGPGGTTASASWTHALHKEGATFVRARFGENSRLDDGGLDRLVLRDGAGEIVATYVRNEMAGRWSPSAIGDTLTIELWVESGGAGGVSVDQVGWGTEPLPGVEPAVAGNIYYSICAAVDSSRIRLADPVARISWVDDCGGMFSCTGWLFSPLDHLMTNAHCVNTAVEAQSMEAWFNYTAAACDSPGLQNPDRYAGAQLYATDCDLDYSVVVLNPRAGVHAASVYGYMPFSTTTPAGGSEIWIPQHPLGLRKQIDESCFINRTRLPGYNGCADPPAGCSSEGFTVSNGADISFNCSIAHGSSGSPVLTTNNVVVALAHAGNAIENFGVRLEPIILDLPNRPLMLTIEGPTTVTEGSSVGFEATALFLTTSPRSVTRRATWSVTPPTAGTVTTEGVFTANLVDRDRVITLAASYMQNGATVADSHRITVADVDLQIAIKESDPPDGAIDAGQPLDPETMMAQGWRFVSTVFNGDVSLLRTGHFSITQLGGDGSPPGVDELTPLAADIVRVDLTAIITPGAWTTLQHVDSQTEVRLGFLPGDVSSDGESNTLDVERLLEEYKKDEPTLPPWSSDPDRSNQTNLLDLMTLLNLLNGAVPFAQWNGVSLPP